MRQGEDLEKKLIGFKFFSRELGIVSIFSGARTS
jgi:hypothetical protein